MELRFPRCWSPAASTRVCLAGLAPASPIKKTALRAAVAWLANHGFQVLGAGELTAPRLYQEDDDRQRAWWFHQALQDPDITGIVCVRGGYGCLRLLPHLDFDLVRTAGKLILGFSDVSALLGPITQRCHLVTIHGPTLAQIPELTPAAQVHLLQLLRGQPPPELVFQPLHFLVPGRAQGPLLGGNLTTITHLIGTPYALELRGHILFLEDHNEALYRLDRFLQQFRLSGSLAGVAGLVLGAFTNCGGKEKIWRLFADLGRLLGVPVAAGLPCGHQADNWALPLGVPAVLDSETAALRLHLRPA